MSLRSVIAQVTRGGRSFHLRRHFSSSDASKDAEYRAIKQNILRYFAAVPVGFLAGFIFEKKEHGESSEESLTLLIDAVREQLHSIFTLKLSDDSLDAFSPVYLAV